MNYWLRYIMLRHRFRLARFYRILLICCTAVLFSFLIYNVPLAGVAFNVPDVRSISLFNIAVSWSERDPRGLLRSAAPVVAWAGNQEDIPEEITPRSLVTAVLAPFRLNLASPPDMLASQMPALAEFKKGNQAPALPVTSSGKEPGLTGAAAGITPYALVGIYYTHTGETYALTDGTERLPGKRGGVVEVGRAIKETLEKNHGVRVAADDRVNDEIYGLSYVESEKTARLLLEGNKDVQILLDIHRDAGKPRSDSLVKINGKELAPILFIVGSDTRSPFPSWRNNYDFAVKLAGRINAAYPGLCIGVRVKEGRYNQFLHPRALLVEIGSVSNSTDEAVESARLLAGVLAGEVTQTVSGNAVKQENRTRAPGAEVREGGDETGSPEYSGAAAEEI